MINVYKKTKPAINDRQQAYATYNPQTHRANALTLLIARNPYLFLGRMPVARLDVVKTPVTKKENTFGQDDPRLDVVLTPSLWRIMQAFTISAAQDSLSQMADLERKLTSQVSKNTLSASMVNNAISMVGLDIKHLLDNEIANVMPVPFSRVALSPNGVLGFLGSYVEKFISSDSFQFGSEASGEGSPIVIANAQSTSLESLSDNLANLIKLFQPVDSSSDIGVIFDVSKRGSVTLTKLPTNINQRHWYEAALDFLLIFQTPDKLKDAMTTLASKFDVSHLEVYLTAQQLLLHKDNSAAAAIVTYYQIAPYIKELKAISEVLKHPFLATRASSQYVNLLAHDRIKDVLAFIDAFPLPGITSVEYSQSQVKSVKIPGYSLPLGCIVPDSVANEFFNSASDFDTLFGASGVLSQLIELDRILSTNRINKEILLAAGNVLGLNYNINVTELVLQPEVETDLVITDGHRINRNEGQALGLTRHHLVSISDANFGRLSLTAKTYKASDSAIVTDEMYQAVNVEGAFKDARAQADELISKGFLDSKAPFFFIRKAYLPDAMIQALRSSKAASVVPFPLAGLAGPEDVFYRAQSVEDLLNQLGYFGATPSSVDSLPFAKRFIVADEAKGVSLKYDNLIIGPTALKFITHSIVSLQSVFSHWKFNLVDNSYGREDGVTLTAAIFFISLPEPSKAAMTLKNAYNASFDADLAGILPTMQD